MDSKFSKAGKDQNSLSTIKQAGQDDVLFIGCYKKLLQWSVSQGKVTKDYGHIMTSAIYSMVQTSDKKYLFVSDIEGH